MMLAKEPGARSQEPGASGQWPGGRLTGHWSLITGHWLLATDACPVCLVVRLVCRYTPQPTDRASALLAKGMDMNQRVDRWGGLVVGYCVAARYYLAAMALASVMQM